MGSEFSIEQSFTLVYEWKLLNQGGIIDRSIQSIPDPIVKLTDIDGDNDMDLVYGSKTGNSNIQIFKYLNIKKCLKKHCNSLNNGILKSNYFELH